MTFWLEFEGNLTIVGILFERTNATAVSMMFELEIKGNLSIVSILFSLRKPTVV